MTSALVKYDLKGSTAIITMDDGKSNVLSPQMIQELNKALDRACKDRAVVVLTGRDGVFSAGFDLRVLKRGGADAIFMLRGGFELAARLLAFPTPVLAACTGHALAMGAFLLLSADKRIGALGDFKLATNEVAIGLTMPSTGVEICRQRLVPAHFTNAAILAETYTPEDAVKAGFLDVVTEVDTTLSSAMVMAADYEKLDMLAHHKTKLKARSETLRTIRKSIQTDTINFVGEGARLYAKKLFKDLSKYLVSSRA